jgi:hypothetical protein
MNISDVQINVIYLCGKITSIIPPGSRGFLLFIYARINVIQSSVLEKSEV